MRRWIVPVLALLALSACSPKPAFRGTDLSGVPWGGDITLTAHTGKRVSTADFRGRAVLLFFGYTHCPDICSPALTKLAALRRELGADAARVQVLFVTVDPARDTVAQLASFVPKFDATFLGLTGSDAELAAAAGEYKVPYPSSAAHVHHLPHSGDVLVKDAAGKVRLLFRQETPVADMTHDLRLLLKNG